MWKNADGISLGQRKYAVEMLNRFRMMECKAMTTPMASSMKLLSDASSEAVDATSSDDWVPDVPDEHETRYLLCCEHLEPILDRSETCSLDSCKAHFEVPKWYS